jgi:hypothetical protein
MKQEAAGSSTDHSTGSPMRIHWNAVQNLLIFVSYRDGWGGGILAGVKEFNWSVASGFFNWV